MRPLLHGDLGAAARALLTVPQPQRKSLCLKMIAEAELVDAHVRSSGRLHPFYGNGSLMAAARNRQLADEPGFDDTQYYQCFELVLRQLARFHLSQRRS